ncbi:hypothetical protein YPC_1754 [Yersinia pestis biovar Medievalis str. Harbin 35]|nr:hypothetical protein YPC_1754 [Yersinia pestis biovar Medievalis str. Harbin 35]EEO76606.1 hypothetical protein YP516_2206 [Yersinia pestis Nepal516]EEO81426.1 hypothetical protein YPF_2151 [Yersinia pestis biovar Orientalis str. India 195]EEO84149.1 hypothetical protein YPH_4029 [Yersinia pestis biovar Orientalis str. PEXU2]ERP75128.1 hypothetical protein L328_08130 [Yersinia pestis 24H]ERP75560.1 hypothetical protein L326_08115 [Yersinia pestis 113]ERP83190.1 hypothetical protein L325_08
MDIIWLALTPTGLHMMASYYYGGSYSGNYS